MLLYYYCNYYIIYAVSCILTILILYMYCQWLFNIIDYTIRVILILWIYKIENFQKKTPRCPIISGEEEEIAPDLKIEEGEMFDELRSSFILEHNYEQLRKSETQNP